MIEMITPGDFRTELILEQALEIPDGAGGFTQAWIEIGVLLAKLEPVAAKDRFGAHQTIEEITHRITIRQRADIASGMRLRRGARLFGIVTVHDPDETGRYLWLRAREQGR